MPKNLPLRHVILRLAEESHGEGDNDRILHFVQNDAPSVILRLAEESHGGRGTTIGFFTSFRMTTDARTMGFFTSFRMTKRAVQNDRGGRGQRAKNDTPSVILRLAEESLSPSRHSEACRRIPRGRGATMGFFTSFRMTTDARTMGFFTSFRMTKDARTIGFFTSFRMTTGGTE